ncbi:MAG: M20 family metallopeptidase [Caldilineaceae bacterium]|nr:M20 family metallopeptidase [Caldilineaceae bacterium]
MISALEQHALDQIDHDLLIRWVQELTRIPSVWRPDVGQGEAEAAAWVADRCREMGLETTVQEVAPGRPNVIARHRFGPGPTLMLEGHTDVVTEGDPSLWSDPPFSAVLRDGRIVGRGANDMKAGVVCALVAARAVLRAGVKLHGALLLGLVCDEEGQMLGIKHFVDQGWADEVSAALICEPEENHLCIAQKGVMWVRVTLCGVMCHGAMPLTGVNTVYPMARFLTLVQSLEEREIARHGQHPYLGQPSITPTILRSPPPGQGEAQNNVMPAACETVLDFRLVPDQDPARLIQALEQMLQAVVAVDERLSYQLDVQEIRQPTRTDPDHPLVQALAGAYTDLTGDPPIYGGVPGSTDGTILYTAKGIPIVTCGPGDIHIPHHVDEWVSVDEIHTAARLYVLAILRYLSISR